MHGHHFIGTMAATGGMTDTEHFYEYEVITQYPQWKKAIEERTIICIRNLEQVAATLLLLS